MKIRIGTYYCSPELNIISSLVVTAIWRFVQDFDYSNCWRGESILISIG